MSLKAYNCKYFSRRGNVFGGCKHPNAVSACIFQDVEDCDISEKRRRKSKNSQQKQLEFPKA